tara:strand:- start:285 stop:2216 length:1932 start_codon:yes stop_codon:yes gene_type:complete
MFNPDKNLNGWKSLLTETLPYEVPVIFSNDLLLASMLAKNIDAKTQIGLTKLRTVNKGYSVPYNYRIAKAEYRTTMLSIVHPLHQIEIAEFYENYKQSMLDYCNRSEMSLRKPVSETQLYTQPGDTSKKTFKLGIPHIDPSDGEIELPHFASYFSYGKYNLLGKFIESAEFRRLEKRYTHMRTLDVSRCFFNIYTHSVTWAAKNKPFAKQQADTYSFEARFDKLMQRTNYNETNGIVVGPECSRIFAEIIFQDIDQLIAKKLKPLEHERDYSIRRYVDDYFIFASDVSKLDSIVTAVEEELERYKLFINPNKTKTSSRPFVSDISLARSELKQLVDYMHDCVDSVMKGVDASAMKAQVRKVRKRALDIRLICQMHSVGFSSLSGWLLSVLRRLIGKLVIAISTAVDDDVKDALLDMAASLLEIAFYICALDVRVRSTYSICQIVSIVGALDKSQTREAYDRLMHLIASELNDIVRSRSFQAKPNVDDADGDVEIYNLLILGAQYIGPDFFKSGYSSDYLKSMLATKPTRYFTYITCKFCFLKDRSLFAEELKTLNKAVAERIVENIHLVRVDSELYLLLCDYLSAPDISNTDKMNLFDKVFGGTSSKKIAEQIGKHAGFVDWDGVRIEHLLRRKTLKPVYAWA